ncbi:MAG TPA: ABC transporter permease subunit [Anaerolineales bacterium]|nr:ABC transporter permease subunit [Anaerolineales bacterium]
MGVLQATRDRFTGRKGRLLREYLTAYAFLSPALLLIFVFGIFPVFFALYVSVHKWQLVRGEFRGLQNYLAAVANLTYIGLFVIALAAFWWAFSNLRKFFTEQRENSRPAAWLPLIPAAVHAAAVLAFFRWIFYQLPEFLDIARKLRGLERTRELYVTLLTDAFLAETSYPHWVAFAGIFLAGFVLGIALLYVWRSRDNASLQLRFTWVWLALAIGFLLLYVTFNAIRAAYATALETGEDPGIWPQFIMIGSGVLLLLLSWRVWQSAEAQTSTLAFAFRIFASISLALGAVLLIIEIPTIVASGDDDMWEGLKVTFFFSAGTVPVQLTIALFLAVLLFQKLKGSQFFRILFFIPYVTPAVASAAVFKQIFSNRASAPANVLMSSLGLETQLWLREPDGVFEIIGSLMSVTVPAWAAGPSLALSVIILQSVWSYVGYNTVIYLAGLGNIPGELTEAAEIDGASKWNVFRYITFPLLSPTTYFLSLLGVIGTFKAFNTIWVMRDGAALGTTDPFSVVIFIEFFTKTRYGYASALSFVLFAIILSLTYINNKVQGSRVFYG